MKISVLTPDEEVYTGEITSVKVPGLTGEFEILGKHAPIVATLKEGKVRMITTSGETQIFAISSGFIEVLYDDISLLVQGYEK